MKWHTAKYWILESRKTIERRDNQNDSPTYEQAPGAQYRYNFLEYMYSSTTTVFLITTVYTHTHYMNILLYI